MKKYFDSISKIYSWSRITIVSTVISILINVIYLLLNKNIAALETYVDSWIILFSVFLLLIILIVFIFQNTLKNHSVNFIDIGLVIAELIAIIGLGFYFISPEKYDNTWLLSMIMISGICFISITVRICFNFFDKSTSGNLSDLRELINGKVKLKPNGEVLVFEETAVEYDLLDRSVLINQLHESLQHIVPQSKFIIGIEGDWGSGKSTILNLVKNMLKETSPDSIVIDNFDPWHYNDERSMLEAILDSIVQEIKIGLPDYRTRSLIKNFTNNIFQKAGLQIFDNFISKSSEVSKSEITTMINDYLTKNNKKIVFLIDNLDRTQKDHIFFIYKAIASLLNLNRIVYIIAYDPIIVNKALSKLDIEEKYLEKIIQLRLHIPEDKDKMIAVEIDALKKFLALFDLSYPEIDEREWITFISQFNNLREFKLFLNNFYYVLSKSLKDLYIPDLVRVNIIKTLNPKLFNLIRNNNKFFITEGLVNDPQLSFTRFNDDILEKDAKEFFDEHSQHDYWKRFKNILKDMFPVIMNYEKGTEGLYKSHHYDEESSSINKRVSNAKYFPVYFTETINNFVLIDKYVEVLIKLITLGSLIQKDIINYITEIITWDQSNQIVFFETIDLHISEIKDESLNTFIDFLIAIINFADDSFTGFSFRLNARSRSIVLLAKALFRLDLDEFKKKADEISVDFANLLLMRNLEYWLSPEAKKVGLYEIQRYEYIKEKLSLKITEVVENNIDLYDKNYYVRLNARCVDWKYYDTKKDLIQQYYRNVVTKDNIGKFLYDFLTVSSSSQGYGYTIDRSRVEEFLPIGSINEYIEKAETTFDNKFVFEVFKKSEGKPVNGFESAIIRKEPIKLFQSN